MKTAPHSIESEQNLLGAILQWPSVLDDVANLIKPEDLYNSDHQAIYRAVLEMTARQKFTDAVTVTEYAASNGLDVGGLAYLGQLAANVPTAANATAYARIIADKATERRLLAVAKEIGDVIYQPGDTESKITQIQQLVGSAIDAAVKDRDPLVVKDLLSGVVDEIEQAFEKKGALTGLSTGLVDLDKKTNGLHPGDLIVIAGRPAMGKSTLAMNIARHSAMTGTPALVFTLEMQAKKLLKRELAAVGHLDHGALRSGTLEDQDWPRLTSAVSQLTSIPLYIDDTPGLSARGLRAKARRMKRKRGIGLVVVDYLQLMDMQGDTRNEAISAVTRVLKCLAMELDVPVIVLSQLNRALEGRPDKRPHLADLRESGAIEQDADVILFVYRDEVYNEDGPYQGLAELIIRKNRDGEPGMVPAVFDGPSCAFRNFAGDWPANAAKPVKQQRGFGYSGNNRAEAAAND